ncbi:MULTISPECIES: hypothetical protein [unclassified Acidisoma]|jgi:hypothetical protein|uniref:hypothetical protein n=1 Tax=unclassified Acidisoma TaxID=2634065 RepID=UPI00131EC2F6|nr:MULTISPECIES: hypothetical protein [unclassified Acidisoma]
MKLRILAFALVAAGLSTSPALAKRNAPGTFAVYGFGKSPCSEFLVARQHNDAQTAGSNQPGKPPEVKDLQYEGYYAFMAGSLTITSLLLNKAYTVTMEDAMDKVAKFCRTYPSSLYVIAVTAVVGPAS